VIIMKKHLVFLLLGLLLVLRAIAAFAAEPYELTLNAFRTDDPKTPVLAVLTLTPADGWHAYGNIQGPSGFPTQIEAMVGENPVQPLYPEPTPGPDPLDPNLIVELYDGPTPFFIPLGATGGKISARIKALLCSSTTCQPIKEELELVLSPSDTLPLAQNQDWWPRFNLAAPGMAPASNPEPGLTDKEPETTDSATFRPRYFAPGLEVHTLSKAAALAFLAGLILNFMPCVLPVITLKLRSFIPAVGSVAASQRQAFRSHNLFFALGMMLYFLILAGIIAVTGMAWGQIFQEPAAIITLTAIVFALSLSLFGVYDLPLIDLKGKARGAAHHPRLESFTTGILATILATPCSGPFLGGVLAWALIQPPDIIALVLSCIGLGMASPYLAMSIFPGLYRFLPRPGAWTLHLERILGFLLAATCVYLFGLLPTTQYLSVLILLWTIALAAWIWGKWTDLNQTTMRRWLVRGAAIGLVVLAAAFLFRPEGHPDPWKNFDMGEFSALRGQENLILDFTADWCPNCKFLEKTVLTPEKSAAFAAKHNAMLMRVDLTRHDPQLMALLESLGSKSIPILAIFPKDNPDSPLVLRDMFTSGQLNEALEQELP
jgi:thiol:disulfide interchange protein DsbD